MNTLCCLQYNCSWNNYVFEKLISYYEILTLILGLADVPLSARNILEDPELKNAVKAFRYHWSYKLLYPFTFQNYFFIDHQTVNICCIIFLGLILCGRGFFFKLRFVYLSLRFSMFWFNLFWECSLWPTFPQIFIKGEFIGGSDIVLNMHQVISFFLSSKYFIIYLRLIIRKKEK